MQQDNSQTQVIELTKEILPGVQFDSEAVTLMGTYTDELSLHRAQKTWTQILDTNFLLESAYDYALQRSKNPAEQQFVLHCQFLTACGRYAFWRLTNDQAPEAQYMIETAHIPLTDTRSADLSQAPDLMPLRTSEISENPTCTATPVISKMPVLVKDILKSIRHLFSR